MQCLQCQYANPAAAKFCLNCGTRLPQVCAQCQQVLPPEAKFCMACGRSLTNEIASETQDEQAFLPDAERRQLTVMFCDLVGSTQLSGQLDPEDPARCDAGVPGCNWGAIARFGGHVAQTLGDGLMVYFGYPVAHEDDAQRSVGAGLEILSAIAALNKRLVARSGIAVAVRVGIHTGLVVAGEVGHFDAGRDGGDRRNPQCGRSRRSAG